MISFLQLVGKGPVTDTEDGSFTIQKAGMLRNTPANRVLDTPICHQNQLYHGCKRWQGGRIDVIVAGARE